VAIAAVLLAAGESTRMGGLKALLEWEGKPLVRYQAETLLAAPVERVLVVLGHRAAELAPLLPSLPRLLTVHNPDYAAGKVRSIVTGVRAVDPSDDVLVLGVDQPRPAGLIARVCAGHTGAITVAGYQGRRGHPAIFAPALRGELLALDEATEGLRAVLRAHANDVRVIETGDPLALVNLNTPEDYAAALRLSSTSSARAGNQ
jgi:CTP:molybdopterin cytidylyltransferase MocA